MDGAGRGSGRVCSTCSRGLPMFHQNTETSGTYGNTENKTEKYWKIPNLPENTQQST